MTPARGDEHVDVSTEWHRLTVALCGGVVAASVLFFGIAALQTPGLDPPPESAALFLVAAVAAAVSTLLLLQSSAVGYPASILSAVIVLGVVAVLVGGTYGPPGPRTNPVGPIAYVALAVALAGSAAAAWRRHSAASRSVHRGTARP